MSDENKREPDSKPNSPSSDHPGGGAPSTRPDSIARYLQRRARALRGDAEARGYVPPSMRGDQPMSGLLHNVIGGMNVSEQVMESLALAYWARAVGPQAADASQADNMRDGVLFVRTRSSVWSHELTLHKPRLIQSLNRMLGGRVVRDIIFRAQGMRKTEKPATEVDTPDAQELAAVVLDPDERAELRVALRKLFTISDNRIRQAIGTRMTADAKLRHWRLERGWKLCTRCSLTHKTDFDLCPNCRLNG